LRNHPNCVAVGCDLLIIDENGEVIGADPHENRPELVEQLLLNGTLGVITHPASTMRRTALLAIGSYREELESLEDFELLLRLSEVGHLSNVPKVLFKYRLHPASVCSTRFRTQERYANTIISEARLRRGLKPLNRSIWPLLHPSDDEAARLQLWSGCFVSLGSRKVALQYAVLALRRRPLSVTSWAALGRVILPKCVKQLLKPLFQRA
jgi:hypothetical protein